MPPLAAEYAATLRAVDRAARTEQRLAAIEAHRTRRRRRDRWIIAVVVVIVPAVGWWLAGWLGVLAALVVGALTAVSLVLLPRLAARRGATAWDWQAQRYRLLGRPADEVQRLDRPRGDRPRR